MYGTHAVQTNLPNFRTGMYRNMQRSYVEFQRFAEQAQHTSPQSQYCFPYVHSAAHCSVNVAYGIKTDVEQPSYLHFHSPRLLL